METRQSAANEVRYNKHRKRKNNELVAGMYAMYITPDENGILRTMEDVGRVYGRNRSQIRDLFRRRGYVIRPYGSPMLYVDGINFYQHSSGYLWGSLPEGRRVMLHRYLWEQKNGPIPSDHFLRFKDGNKQNVAYSNLELISKSDLARFITKVRRPRRKFDYAQPRRETASPRKWL